MKEPVTSQNGDRFGTFVKRIRQKDPREITSIRLVNLKSYCALCTVQGGAKSLSGCPLGNGAGSFAQKRRNHKGN